MRLRFAVLAVIVMILSLVSVPTAADADDCLTCCMNYDGTSECTAEAGVGPCCLIAKGHYFIYKCFPSNCSAPQSESAAQPDQVGGLTLEDILLAPTFTFGC